MAISRDDVQKVSLLARLRLSDAELDQMTEQLASIVAYVDQLSELNTNDVEPLAHPIEVFNVFAEDTTGAELSREDALANAPKQDGEFYNVPAVLGE